MASQTLYCRVVSTKLPLAVPSQLNHIDQFGVGKVLIFSKKPRRFAPWKNNDLKFTGLAMSSLLEESCIKDVAITASSNLEFTSSADDPLKLEIDLRADAALKQALLIDLQINTGEATEATVSADFGKVKRIDANLLSSCMTKNLRVRRDHPTIQEAIATGNTLFLITAIYEGERCKLNLSLGGQQHELFSQDEPTTIAFLLLKLYIGKDGVLQPKLNKGPLSILERHSAPSVVTAPSDQEPNPEAAPDPTDAIRRNFQSFVSLEEGGWIIVDVINPGQVSEDTIQEEEAVPFPDHPPESQLQFPDHPPEALQNFPDHPPTLETHEDETTTSAPAEEPNETPVQMQEKVLVKEVADLASAPVLEASAPLSIVGQLSSPQLDEHYVYSLKDFQPFESNTYNGIYNEVEQWIKPLVTNTALHSVYLSYVAPPKSVEKLKKLSAFFQEYGNALRAHKPTPANTYIPLDPVISALRTEWALQLDEVSSLIIVSEALIEFPQHIVKKAVELSAEKRTTLIEFIRATPYGIDKHVYMDEGPFMDPDLQPFMTRMGFSLPQHTKNLVLDLSHEENEDRLAAGLILLMATRPQ